MYCTYLWHTRFVFVRVGLHASSIRLQSARYVALGADVHDGLYAVQMGYFNGNVQMTSRERWAMVTCPVTFAVDNGHKSVRELKLS